VVGVGGGGRGDGRRVARRAAATLRCTMAGAIADWVRGEIAPAAAALGAPLRAIENYDSYDCRGQNRVKGAKLSEHGKANALDIRSLKLADGKTVRLTDVAVARALPQRLRPSARVRLMTVPGPGPAGHHQGPTHRGLA